MPHSPAPDGNAPDLAARADALHDRIRRHLDACGAHEPSLPPELVHSFPAEPAAVPRIRRAVGRFLAYRGQAGAAETAELCVSELLTNVIRHIGPGTPVTLHVTGTGTAPRIELTDPRPGLLPAPWPPTPDLESGRGLTLIDALTVEWGTRRCGEGKTVWCVVGGAGPG